jgi:hypothetical protein
MVYLNASVVPAAFARVPTWPLLGPLTWPASVGLCLVFTALAFTDQQEKKNTTAQRQYHHSPDNNNNKTECRVIHLQVTAGTPATPTYLHPHTAHHTYHITSHIRIRMHMLITATRKIYSIYLL